MRHNTTKTVFSYFNRIRGGNTAPLRSDINPADITNVLPNVFLLETVRPASTVFRLAGTQVCSILGRELRGEDFKYIWDATNRHKVKLSMDAVLANQVPMLMTINSVAQDEVDGDLEMLLMPLFSKPGVCDRMFGSLADLSRPPLLKEKLRSFSAVNLGFISSGTLHSTSHEDGAMPVTSHVASLRTRVMHLTVLEGGRKG